MTAQTPASTMNHPSVHFEVAGFGDPLVFTHGFGDDGSTWSGQVTRFRSTWRVAVWDLLAHGRSPAPTDPAAYSRELALDELAAVHAAAGEGPAVLVGHSFGGFLSLARAVTAPEQVRALVLVATGPGFRDPDALAKWNRTAFAAVRRFGLPEAAAHLLQQHDSLVISKLDVLEMPTLLIVGERDKAYHPGLRYLERRIPHATSHVIPDAGHNVHRSHADVVNEVIVRFLERL